MTSVLSSVTAERNAGKSGISLHAAAKYSSVTAKKGHFSSVSAKKILVV